MSLFDRLLRRAPAAPGGPLDARGLLQSDLWIDQPDAAAEIDRRLGQGRITAEQAAGLRHFVEQGYLTFSLDLPAEVYGALDAEVERLWRDHPDDVAYAFHGPLKPFSYAEGTAERQPSYRIADLHGTSEPACELFLHPKVFEWVRLALGLEPVATQSLTFEFGSQQALHRDPVFVQTQPPSHLVAAWIALEDIHPRSGPLVYVPGSHRLPYFQLAPGQHLFDHKKHGPAEIAAMAEFDRAQMAERGMEVVAFTPKRGEVLLWHHSLLHGGSPSEDLALTRKSFVIHFSSREHYKRLKQTYLERVPLPEGGFAERPRIVETERLLERAGCAGFASPLAEWRAGRR